MVLKAPLIISPSSPADMAPVARAQQVSAVL